MATELKLKRGRPPKERNEVTSELLATGEATMAQLAQLFETDAKTLPRRLRGIRPAGTRNNASTYKIRDAASRLVKPGYSIEQYLQRMHPNELPVGLMKEFWAGQKSRQEFEIKAGDLWNTAQVVEALAEAFKVARMTILLMPETIERETGVTDGQRKVLRRLTDGLIDELREALVEKFKDYEPTTRPAELPSFNGVGPGEDGDRVLQTEEDEEDPD
ncbi:MAG TPA: DUF1441 family protein, partial [Rhizobium sp.]|nr:DUF1441 family protein [Rhizobium sp.]